MRKSVINETNSKSADSAKILFKNTTAEGENPFAELRHYYAVARPFLPRTTTKMQFVEILIDFEFQ